MGSRKLRHILLPPPITHHDNKYNNEFDNNNNNNNKDENKYNDHRDAQMVQQAFVRSHRTGKSVAWFFRVISNALTLALRSLNLQQDRTEKQHWNNPFRPCHILEALANNGGGLGLAPVYIDAMDHSNLDEGGSRNNNENEKVNDDYNKNKNKKNTKSKVSYVPAEGLDVGGWDQTRLQTLMDLPVPELAVLLAARRILARDDGHEEWARPPLSARRIFAEIRTLRTGGGMAGVAIFPSVECGEKSGTYIDEDDGPRGALTRLVVTGLVKTALNHQGGAMLQYCSTPASALRGWGISDDGYGSGNCDGIPLHVNIDIEEELMVALRRGLLGCPTALKDWGLRMN